MFIAMPCYEGETLQEKIANGPVETGEAIDIVMQLPHPTRGLPLQ